LPGNSLAGNLGGALAARLLAIGENLEAIATDPGRNVDRVRAVGDWLRGQIHDEQTSPALLDKIAAECVAVPAFRRRVETVLLRLARRRSAGGVKLHGPLASEGAWFVSQLRRCSDFGKVQHARDPPGPR